MRSPPSSGSPADRLTTALATLIKTGAPTPQKATVTQLCRLADVSRNSLYRYHPGILATLRQHQHAGEASTPSAAPSERLLRQENAALRAQQLTLVALIDHLYLAHREASTLLARRERELADVRRLLNTKPSLVRR